jgi:hypothetical protein
MQLPLSQADVSNAYAVQLMKPTSHTGNSKATAAAHKLALPAVNHSDLVQVVKLESKQPSVPQLEKAEPLTVVQQTINDLEEQGLLMVFDRHDQIAKRLTGSLIAAGVLPENIDLSEREE